jgi:hypothetical protein
VNTSELWWIHSTYHFHFSLSFGRDNIWWSMDNCLRTPFRMIPCYIGTCGWSNKMYLIWSLEKTFWFRLFSMTGNIRFAIDGVLKSLELLSKSRFLFKSQDSKRLARTSMLSVLRLGICSGRWSNSISSKSIQLRILAIQRNLYYFLSRTISKGTEKRLFVTTRECKIGSQIRRI